MKKLIKQSGFALPELITVLALTSIFVGLIVFFGFSYWRYGSLQEADQDTFITRLNAGDFLRENLGTSAGLIIQNSITDSNTHNPDPDIGSNLYWIPIHAIPGTASVSGSGTKPLLYFTRLSFNSNGAVIMNGSAPYEDEFVLYLDNAAKQLMLRSLANPSASGNRLLTSCPAAIATASCPADKVIAADMSSVATRYFSRSGNLIDHSSITDPDSGEFIGPDFPAVEVLELTLNLSKKPFLQKTDATINQTVIRLALRNS